MSPHGLRVKIQIIKLEGPSNQICRMSVLKGLRNYIVLLQKNQAVVHLLCNDVDLKEGSFLFSSYTLPHKK